MPVRINMDRARLIHLREIRRVRDSELAGLDVPWMKAMESGDTMRQAEISTRKQRLRDIPQEFSLVTATDTPAELRALWPAELSAG